MNSDENKMNRQDNDLGLDLDKESAKIEQLLFGGEEMTPDLTVAENDSALIDDLINSAVQTVVNEPENSDETPLTPANVEKAADAEDTQKASPISPIPPIPSESDVNSESVDEILSDVMPDFADNSAATDNFAEAEKPEFTDISSDEPEKNVDNGPSEQYSTYQPVEKYDVDNMPHFFTESSEYDEEKPLDISDFYPPEKPEAPETANVQEDVAAAVTAAAIGDEIIDNAPDIADIADMAPLDNDFVPETQDFEENYEQPDEPELFEFDNGTENAFVGYDDAIDEAVDDIGATREFDASDIEPQSNNYEATRVFDAVNPDSDIAAAGKSAMTDVEPTKKKNGFVRFLSSFVPWKGDTKKEVLRKIIFIVAFFTLIAMVWQVLSYYILEPMNNEKLTQNLKSKYYASETSDYSSATMNPKFAALYKENPDLVGWIKIDGTNVDYPIVQGKDNEQYKRADFNGKYSRYGSIFMDSGISIEFQKESRNLVIYGHNMKDDSTMFGQLTHYRNLSFYQQHPTFRMDTLFNDGTWKIFAVMTTNAYAAQDNGMLFNFRKNSFMDDAEFNNWINECKMRSCINTNVDVLPTDTVTALQTCVYEFSEARLVIMARRCRPGEDKSVDTAAATNNINAKYPQAWYDSKGLSNPFKDDSSFYTTAPNTTVMSNPVTLPAQNDGKQPTAGEVQTVTVTVNVGGQTVVQYQTVNGNDGDGTAKPKTTVKANSTTGKTVAKPKTTAKSTTKAHVTEAPETDTPETDPPKTDAPETDAPSEE